MTPKQFLQQIRKEPAAGYVFLGDELYYRDLCRGALLKAVVGEAGDDDAAEGLVEIDLAEQPLAKLLDEARTFSLFSSSRLIVGYHAESALPRRVTTQTPETELLREYFASPTPGVVVLIESTRYDWGERDDKTKLERLLKFFAPVPETVRLERPSQEEALAAARDMARKANLEIDAAALAELVEMLGADLARLANDLEKLSLYGAGKKGLNRGDIELLVPEARQRGTFEFSDALARRDRRQALDILDTLARAGEYWPMQINLLAALFRQALAIKEESLRSVPQVMRLFQSRGIRTWPKRAQQTLGVANRFSGDELERALIALFEADRDLRRERPDDRVVMEKLVLSLTG